MIVFGWVAAGAGLSKLIFIRAYEGRFGETCTRCYPPSATHQHGRFFPDGVRRGRHRPQGMSIESKFAFWKLALRCWLAIRPNSEWANVENSHPPQHGRFDRRTRPEARSPAGRRRTRGEPAPRCGLHPTGTSPETESRSSGRQARAGGRCGAAMDRCALRSARANAGDPLACWGAVRPQSEADCGHGRGNPRHVGRASRRGERS